MTDIMSEAFGRELNARTEFRNESVWLPLLAVHQMNSGDPVVRGKTFTDCLIEGPALIAPMNDVVFDSCNMGLARDPRSLFYKGQGPTLAGAIGFADTRFVRCRFVQVGFTGDPQAMDRMAEDLVSARQTLEQGQA